MKRSNLILTLVVSLAAAALCLPTLSHARQYFAPEYLHKTVDRMTSSPTPGSLQIDFHATSYAKHASRAFMDSLLQTEELTALFFGKSDFRLSHIFEDCYLPLNTEYYNPYMRILTLSPRATYSETGLNCSFGVKTALFNEKTRVGIKVTVPFKSREIERKDAGWRDTEQVQNVVAQRPGYVGATNTLSADQGFAYRLDLVEAVPQNQNGADETAWSALQYSLNDAERTAGGPFTGVRAFDQAISGNGLASSGIDVAAALAHSPEDHVPSDVKIAVLSRIKTSTNSQNDIQSNNSAATNLSNMTDTGTLYYFSNSDYSKLADSADKTVAQRVKDQDIKAATWLISTYSAPGTPYGTLSTDMINALSAYRSNVYEWLYDRGYTFESNEVAGLGDVSFETYIEHDLTPYITLQLTVGVTAPTARGNATSQNPYAVDLGTRGHAQTFVGGSITLTPEAGSSLDMFSLSLATTYTHAFSGREMRAATPRGALIKNIGKEMGADVSWNTLVADALVSWRHPLSPHISGDIGYHLYYKDRDAIQFAQPRTESWLGKKFGTQKYTEEYIIVLDEAVAAQATESSAHKLSFHLYYQPSDYLLFSCGFGRTVAGRHTPEESEYMLGISISR